MKLQTVNKNPHTAQFNTNSSAKCTGMRVSGFYFLSEKHNMVYKTVGKKPTGIWWLTEQRKGPDKSSLDSKLLSML